MGTPAVPAALLLAALVAVPSVARAAADGAEIGEPGRDGCIRLERNPPAAAAPYTEICVQHGGDESLLTRRRAGGEPLVFDRYPRTAADISAYLVTTPTGRQWLFVESEAGRQGSQWVLWDLNAGVRTMHGRSSNIPYVRDLDRDGHAELVVYEDLLLTPTMLWQDEAFGLPRIYRLDDSLESRSLRDHPSVVRDFIQQADIAIEAFAAPCAGMTEAQRGQDATCREIDGYAAAAARARDFAQLFLSGRPPPR